MPLEVAEVLANDVVSPRCRVMTLRAPKNAGAALPGQFFMLETAPGWAPLWRRAFTYYGLDAGQGTVRVLYEVAGVGTQAMASWTRGDRASILGPLGRGFPIEAAPVTVLIGGGVGLAPFPPVLRALRARFPKQRLELFAGARSEAELGFLEDFAPLVDRIEIATDDGSIGRPGYVTGVLAAHLDGIDEQARFLACGPKPMLSALHRMLAARGRFAWVSLEERMGCGFGVCYGCVVERQGGEDYHRYSRICVEGPVYDSRELRW